MFVLSLLVSELLSSQKIRSFIFSPKESELFVELFGKTHPHHQFETCIEILSIFHSASVFHGTLLYISTQI